MPNTNRAAAENIRDYHTLLACAIAQGATVEGFARATRNTRFDYLARCWRAGHNGARAPRTLAALQAAYVEEARLAIEADARLRAAGIAA